MKLQSKLLIFFLPLSVAAGLTLLFLAKRSIHGIVIGEVTSRVLLRSDDLEAALTRALASRDENRILEVLHPYMERVGASYAIALDTQGVVVAHSNVVEKGKIFRDPVTQAALRSSKPVHAETDPEGEPVLDVAFPVFGFYPDPEDLLLRAPGGRSARIGTVRVGVPLADFLRTENRIVRRFFWIIISVLGIFILLAFILLRQILLPVRLLGAATEKIARGRYDARVPVLSGDEMGELAKRFNLMSSELERRTGELSRSNQELEQFAYVASHDLQEPLRMMTSYIQLLAHEYQGKLSREADEYIAFAVDGSRRMKGLIDALLSYSRVGSHSRGLEPVDFSKPLQNAVQNLKVALEESGGDVEAGPLPTLKADPSQITALFQNLLGNALKFRGERAPRVRVTARKEPGEWIFAVQDNGIGIKPEYFDKIFVIFQRLNRRDAYPGMGIGLAICKKIVQRHGGRIWVESRPGEGSTFYFSIPEGGKHES